MSDRETTDVVARLRWNAENSATASRLNMGMDCLNAADEIERLRRAVAYARVRLKRPCYGERLDKIISGELDREHEQADRTPITRGIVHGR